MKLIFGLGNPGTQYGGTRHNIGFAVLEELAGRRAAGNPQTRYESECREIAAGGEKVLLIAPLTFMNCSGEAVSRFVRFYKPDPADLVVVCDDMNLPCGRMRWRAQGSAGGQRGLEDIIRRLGTNDFPRLRIGIDRPPPRVTATSWVLGRFHPDELDAVRETVVRAADSLEFWVREGIEPTMTAFNRDPSAGESVDR